MKKLIIIFLTFLFSNFVFADDGGYSIKNFDIIMNLNNDGSADVKETIDVNFSQSRHGIYRNIPVLSDQGYRQIENFQAGNDPIASRGITNGFYQIKIGDRNSTFIGDHSYHISYKILNAIKQYSGYQELTWNLVGTDWQTNIKNTTYTINFPKDYYVKDEDLKLFYGKKGDRYQDKFSNFRNYSSFSGELKNNLEPYQGVTIGIKFPDNFFSLENEYLFGTQVFDNINNSTSNNNSIVLGNVFSGIISFIFQLIFILPFIIFGFISKFFIKSKISGIQTKRKIPKTYAIQYSAPNINIYHAFWIWYGEYNSHLFGAIFYYWIIEKYVILKQIGKNYSLCYQTNNLSYLSLDKILLSGFFDISEKLLNSNLSSECERIFKLIKSDIKEKTNFIEDGFGGEKLTQEGQRILDYLAGYKDFIEKVDKNVIETQLKYDPNFVSKTLPWAVLFGLDTKFMIFAKPYLEKTDWYNPNIDINNTIVIFSDNYYRNYYPINNSNGNSFSSSGSSFSSSSSGSSGGGGGGGGGGSW